VARGNAEHGSQAFLIKAVGWRSGAHRVDFSRIGAYNDLLVKSGKLKLLALGGSTLLCSNAPPWRSRSGRIVPRQPWWEYRACGNARCHCEG
jgi:hypothetical protein